MRVWRLTYTIIILFALVLSSCASAKPSVDLGSSFDPSEVRGCDFPEPQPLESIEDYQDLLTEMYNDLLQCDYQNRMILKYLSNFIYTHSDN